MSDSCPLQSGQCGWPPGRAGVLYHGAVHVPGPGRLEVPGFGEAEGHPGGAGGAAGSDAALCLQGSQQNSVNMYTLYTTVWFKVLCYVFPSILCLMPCNDLQSLIAVLILPSTLHADFSCSQL